MALNGTYAGLLASVAEYLHRPDLAASIPDFVTLAESRISRDLRIRKQIVTTVLTATSGLRSVALPADWLELENISIASPVERQLIYVTVEQLDSRYPQGGISGLPGVYTIEGDNVLLGPAPDSAYNVNLIYYARLPALATASTNWLMVNHPSIYLFAALAESAPFIGDDKRSQLWNDKYRADCLTLQVQDDRATHSGSVLRVKTF